MSTKTQKKPEPAPIYYLAGPMSGIPKFNYPLFFDTAAKLRKEGHLVVNPAEQDTPEVMREVLASETGDITKLNGPSWGQFLAHDVKLVADSVDAIIVLPGWQNSKGACTEVFIATLLGKPVFRGILAMYANSPPNFSSVSPHSRTVTPGPLIDKEEISLVLMKKLLA